MAKKRAARKPRELETRKSETRSKNINGWKRGQYQCFQET